MGKHTDLAMIFMTFVIHAVASKRSEDTEDLIYQIGQAKGMLFILKVLGFDIEDMKQDCIVHIEKSSKHIDKDNDIKKEDIISLIECIYKDTVDHIDQIIGGMLLKDAQQ